MSKAMALALLVAATHSAYADRDLCAGGIHHGATLDLDVKEADLHDVFRLLAKTASVNLVVSDEVVGTVTLSLRHVAWQDAACAIAGLDHLRITVQHSIILVRKQGPT